MSNKQQRQELDELRQDLDALRAGQGQGQVRRAGVIEDLEWFGKRAPGTEHVPRFRKLGPNDWYGRYETPDEAA
jgi:hypothetical protein